jgi:hypothetical protein
MRSFSATVVLAVALAAAACACASPADASPVVAATRRLQQENNPNACAPGTFNPQGGGVTCEVCPAGSWCPGGVPGQARAFACPGGTSSPPGSSSQSQCVPPATPAPTGTASPTLQPGQATLLQDLLTLAALNALSARGGRPAAASGSASGGSVTNSAVVGGNGRRLLDTMTTTPAATTPVATTPAATTPAATTPAATVQPVQATLLQDLLALAALDSLAARDGEPAAASGSASGGSVTNSVVVGGGIRG